MTSFVPLGHEPAPWPEDLPPRLSATQITMLERCPEQYRQRYILGNKEAPGAALILGKADTNAVAAHLTKYMHDEVGLTHNEIAERFAVEYDQAVDEAGGLTEIKWRNDGPVALAGAKAMAGKDKDTGTKLVTLYRKMVAPQYQHELEGVEQEITIENPAWQVPIIGYLDVETSQDIIERKTAGRKNSSPQGAWIMQARIYQLAIPKPLWWHQSVKAKEPFVVGNDPEMMSPVDNLMRVRTVRTVQMAQANLVNLYSTYGPDESWDGALTHPWACGFCGFRANCWWWGN